MKILLDTCTFLWMVGDPAQLSQGVRELIVDPGNDVYLSAVSSWEIALKHSLGRLPLPQSPARFIPAQREAHGVDALPLGEEAALHLARLPKMHADPFDRMLVSQAIVHGLTLVTPDEQIAQYPIRVIW